METRPVTVVITPEQRAQRLAYGARSAAGEDIDPFPVERKSASCAAHLGGRTLQETLQLCTDKCGKSACKVLAKSLILPALRNKSERKSISIS
jgi:hypothetical protein